MSQIFISHASVNNAEAVAVHDWLIDLGWSDLFLDLDPERGIKPGQRWQDALKHGVERCELILFLISPSWINSVWCLQELHLARTMNKPLFGVIVEPTPVAEIPPELKDEWQLTDLTVGNRDHAITVSLPRDAGVVTVRFASDALNRLRLGLLNTGLNPSYFKWPPDHDPSRSPFRGLKPLDVDDAGIFFGREGSIITGLDRLRALREAAAPRLLVILGASGAGKSSFMRAGLLPRLTRDDQHFLPLKVVRPERAAITGENGFAAALRFASSGNASDPGVGDTVRLSAAMEAEAVHEALSAIADQKVNALRLGGSEVKNSPSIVIAVDQAEELFTADGREEAQSFLAILNSLLSDTALNVIAILTIRSDRYEALQTAPALAGLRQQMLSLAPIARGAFVQVIEGPAKRVLSNKRKFVIEEPLVQLLLADIEIGSSKDALPLLSFTLERLYSEYRQSDRLTLDHYRQLGGIQGSIKAAVAKALQAADDNPSIPKDSAARLTLLRHGLVPWLASIDPETGGARRRVARRSEIPPACLPLLDLLEQQRLLSSDIAAGTGEPTIEPAHEALLRQWDELADWLKEDASQLNVIDAVKRASKTWQEKGKAKGWLTHTGSNLVAAEQLRHREHLAHFLDSSDWEYISECRRKVRRQLVQLGALVVIILLSLAAWYTESRWRPVVDASFHKLINMRQELSQAGATFRDCSYCPEFVVVPPGSFVMGSPASELDRKADEAPRNRITFHQAVAISKFEVTFAQWNACVDAGRCYRANDGGWEGSNRPVINVSWNDIVKQYLPWIREVTGLPYRLLTEAEWEYAARGGSHSPFFWGNEVGHGNANCAICGSKWDRAQSAPVGSFKPNSFGLHDMNGNVLEWVEDCYLEYTDPDFGNNRSSQDRCERVMRGGSYIGNARSVRAAMRNPVAPTFRYGHAGFRVARELVEIGAQVRAPTILALDERLPSDSDGGVDNKHSSARSGGDTVAGFRLSEFRSTDGMQMPSCDGSPAPERVPVVARGLANLALLKTAIASTSSTIAGFTNIHDTTHLNDGWYNNCRSWIPASMPAWAEIDLGDTFEVHLVRFGSEHSPYWKDRSPRDYEIRLRRDSGSVWSVAWRARVSDEAVTETREFAISPQIARYVSIGIAATAGGDTVRLDELEIYGRRP